MLRSGEAERGGGDGGGEQRGARVVQGAGWDGNEAEGR